MLKTLKSGGGGLGGIAKLGELLGRVAVGELGEALVRDAVPQIDDEHPLDEGGHLVGADGFPDLPGDRLVSSTPPPSTMW